MAEAPQSQNQEKTYDVGSNLEKLGFTFLFLKYVLPIVVGLFVLGAGVWLLAHFFNGITLNSNDAAAAIFVVAIIALLVAQKK